MDPLFVDQPSPDSDTNSHLFVDEPLPSPIESFGRGAISNFPLATQALAGMSQGPYSQNLADLKAKAQTAKAVNPKSYGAGAVTGAVAPVFIPGAGEALEAYPIAGNAALGAANAISDTDLSKQPEEALKQAAIGAGIGGTVGGVASKMMGEVPEKLEQFANKKGIQSLGIQPGELGVSGEKIQNMGQMAQDMGLFKGPIEERFNTAKDLVKQTGKQIEDLGEGKVLTNTAPYTQQLHEALQESSQVYGPKLNPEANLYRQGIANLQKPGGVSFDELQTLKNAYAERAFDKIGNIKNDAAFTAYKTMSDAMEELAANHPEYPALKETYSNLRSMENGLERQLQNEQAKGMQTHGIGMMGRMGGAITGGNVPMTLGAAAILAPAHPLWAASLASTIAGNPAAMQGAARSLASAVPKAVQTGTQALNDYLISKYGPKAKEVLKHSGIEGTNRTIDELRE